MTTTTTMMMMMINGDEDDDADDDDDGDMMIYATIFRKTMRRDDFRVKMVIRVLVLGFLFSRFLHNDF